MKTALYKLLIVLLVFIALALTIPPIPSVEVGHGYDTFPNPSLFIGLVLIALSALISIKTLNSPKLYWGFSGIGYVLFSLAIHARVWW
ncbi:MULTISPECIES: hypothetical protein [unclassified Colwellia]|uniref:hypothetical protein n=1 Tax=unclassified Colwellia TaxID=196834 RepID=UPI0015F71C1F|nr:MULTISPECIES: hypothetical protein [unclassified Colwellia]MBA6231343.1 hypothetical protein [Colwellia sp. MB02u-7]MBA6235840.1 hypothetical protein [Colwellia sp. MB02u-11]MBA6298776.1 hypothetical protein [Colwellia sp. MB3u-22]MBA6310200.1 hypothetical protein [Colwellia sp. MB3u-64]